MADAPTDFQYTELLPLGPDDTPYRLVTTDGVSTFETPEGTFLKVEPSAITALTAAAMHDIAHFLRPAHLAQLRKVLDDPEASDNDRFVALDLLKNASIAAGGVLPMCQDTGTAIVKGKKGQFVFTGGGDEAAIAEGVQQTYQTSNLRYSQMAPITMYEERNTGTNLPAEIKISAVDGDGLLVPVHRQGRRQRQQVVPVPGDQGAAQRGDAAAVDLREDAGARHGGLPAVPPRRRHRRHVGRVRRGDGQAGLDALPRHAAHRRARRPATASATSSWRPRSSRWPSRPASAPSSAASTSATTCASSACPATAPAARWRWPCRARPTARPRARSPPTACSSSSWRPIRPASCPRSPTSSTRRRPCTSTSTGRCPRSSPSCRSTR